MQKEHRFTAQKTWDTIAESFDTTRQKPWSICLDYISTLQPNDIIVDLGCGNGRHLIPSAHRCSQALGIDLSQKFLMIIKNKLKKMNLMNISLIHGDAVHLPFADRSIDAILFIASLHNIQGKDNRQTALLELARVLKPQGTALISVWSRWQDKYYRHFFKQYFKRDHEFGDINISWKHHNLNIPRFYHLYSRGEFRKELQQSGLMIQSLKSVYITSRRFPDNYFAVIQKA